MLLFLAARWAVLRRAVGFLTSEHPNGSLLPRRYARMLALTALSLIWWNGMVAPALYGNDAARKYLKLAVTNFDRKFREVARGAEVRSGPRLHPHRKVRGADEYARRSGRDAPLPVSDGEGQGRSAAAHGRRGVEGVPEAPGTRRDTGSPFPIFAAHRVTLPGDQQKLGLIDGGYSNDVPIDAARTIAARQVLVVHSAPVTEDVHEHGETKSFSLSPGMLIRNAGRCRRSCSSAASNPIVSAVRTSS